MRSFKAVIPAVLMLGAGLLASGCTGAKSMIELVNDAQTTANTAQQNAAAAMQAAQKAQSAADAAALKAQEADLAAQAAQTKIDAMAAEAQQQQIVLQKHIRRHHHRHPAAKTKTP